MVRPIREDEIAYLWEILEKGNKSSSGKNGYVRFKYKGRNYKRSRIIYQIYNQVILEDGEIIHHKDRDKSNDYIKNLELSTSYEK